MLSWSAGSSESEKGFRIDRWCIAPQLGIPVVHHPRNSMKGSRTSSTALLDEQMVYRFCWLQRSRNKISGFSIRNESARGMDFLRRHLRPIQPSTIFMIRSTSPTEVCVSWCPWYWFERFRYKLTAVFLAEIVIPRSFSRSFESIARSCNSYIHQGVRLFQQFVYQGVFMVNVGNNRSTNIFS